MTHLDRRKVLQRILHPDEKVVLVLSLLANLAIVAGVVAVLVLAPEWLAAHPRAHSIAQRIRTAAILVLLALPILPLWERAKLALVRENAVRLGREQVPELYAIVEQQALALGMTNVPELYVSARVGPDVATAYSMPGRKVHAIVLGVAIFAGLKRISDRFDAYSFILAHEMARIYLGHASWWQDLFVGYLQRIPVLRLPLLTVQTLARDRLAAKLVPDGIRGLLIQASGGDLLASTDVDEYVRSVLQGPSPFARVASFRRASPHLSLRVRALYKEGYFHLSATQEPAAPVAH